MPIVSHARVFKLMRTFHDQFRTLMKPYNGRKGDKKNNEKLQNFQKKCREKLFDIAACKCVPESCKGPTFRKVPKEEQEFMKDQRMIRIMIIEGTDRITSTTLKKRKERQMKGEVEIND